jgi:hypothetical protein
MPLWPVLTTRRTSPTSVTTAGVPLPSASSKAIGMPS